MIVPDITKCKICNESIDFNVFPTCWNCGANKFGVKADYIEKIKGINSNNTSKIETMTNKESNSVNYPILNLISILANVFGWLNIASSTILLFILNTTNNNPNGSFRQQFNLILIFLYGMPNSRLELNIKIILQCLAYCLFMFGLSELIKLLLNINSKFKSNGGEFSTASTQSKSQKSSSSVSLITLTVVIITVSLILALSK